jgi:hypothetical protein
VRRERIQWEFDSPRTHHGSVTLLVRRLRCRRGERDSISLRSANLASLAQSAELSAHNGPGPGSSPGGCTSLRALPSATARQARTARRLPRRLVRRSLGEGGSLQGEGVPNSRFGERRWSGRQSVSKTEGSARTEVRTLSSPPVSGSANQDGWCRRCAVNAVPLRQEVRFPPLPTMRM